MTAVPAIAPIVPRVPPQQMGSDNRMRARQAAFRAKNLYPGVVGVTLSRELMDWEQFGYRLGNGGTILELIDHCLQTPLPSKTP